MIPSTLIILFNIKAGRFLFKNPMIGLISSLPTSIFIYRASQPFIASLNNWIDKRRNNFEEYNEVIDTDSIPIDD